MNEIQIFKNDQFGTVRTVEEDGKVLFCGKDIADALGYSNSRDAMDRHCKGVVKHDVGVQTGFKSDGTPAIQYVGMSFIPEGDVYRLITHSKLPSAERFESWVFDEVLPSIRKHGAYMTEQTIEKALTSPDFLIRLATQLKDEQDKRKELEAEKQALLPKAEFYDAVAGSKDAIEMQYVAKVLAIKGLGRNNLFELLRNKGILDRNNIPYQRYIDQGYFRTIEQKYPVPTGEIRINIKTLVYQKGVDYIRKIAKEAM